MPGLASVRAVVRGRVQGVYFRAFVARWAAALGLSGYVRNLPGGRSVEVVAQGEREKLEELLRQAKVGPPGARVEEMSAEWSAYSAKYAGFEIRY